MSSFILLCEYTQIPHGPTSDDARAILHQLMPTLLDLRSPRSSSFSSSTSQHRQMARLIESLLYLPRVSEVDATHDHDKFEFLFSHLMATPPSRAAILGLYTSTLRASRSFSSYNFREYFLRRTRETFRAMQAESDPNRVGAMYADAVKELGVLRRSAIVNQLYGGWKLAVEDGDKLV